MSRASRARTWAVPVLAIAGALVPSPADAHLVTTGLGPIYDGVSHVLLSPDDLIPILAMGLLAGLNGPTAGRRTLFTLTAAWLAGGIAGYAAAPGPGTFTSTAVSFLALGALTAVDRRLSAAVVAMIAASVGFFHGWLNGAGIADAQRELLGLVGIAGATFVLVALAAALVVSLRKEWTRIAVRVAGSWIAAIGLLMLGWSLRGGA